MKEKTIHKRVNIKTVILCSVCFSCSLPPFSLLHEDGRKGKTKNERWGKEGGREVRKMRRGKDG